MWFLCVDKRYRNRNLASLLIATLLNSFNDKENTVFLFKIEGYSLPFRNIVKTGFLVTQHSINENFGDLIAPILFSTASELDSLASAEQITNEQTHTQRFRYEYFAVNIGSAAYRGGGASLKKTTSTAQTSGTAYRIYGCGYMMPKEEAGFDNPDILVPLETVVVLSN